MITKSWKLRVCSGINFSNPESSTISVTNSKGKAAIASEVARLDRIISKKAILFDMDGVLVDVRDSYRKAIQQTVLFFAKEKPDSLEIQRLKENGGYNNDWDLTEALMISRGKCVPKQEIVEKFQEFYLGRNRKPGLIENEKWLLSKEKLVKLHKEYRLGIVTGRPRAETFYVLEKFGMEQFFDVVIAMEDYPAEKAKPDPYPICLALKKLNTEKAVYVGDSVDDIESAKRAGIEAIGCIPPGVHSESLKDLLLMRGAQKVLENISQL